MNGVLRIVCVARHGETAWSLSGQCTGIADLAVTEGVTAPRARHLGPHLNGIALVFASPSKRDIRTSELAGLGNPAEIDHDLVQWGARHVEDRLSSVVPRRDMEMRIGERWS
jgi:broad specificity phosphatase PhoE